MTFMTATKAKEIFQLLKVLSLFWINIRKKLNLSLVSNFYQFEVSLSVYTWCKWHWQQIKRNKRKVNTATSLHAILLVTVQPKKETNKLIKRITSTLAHNITILHKFIVVDKWINPFSLKVKTPILRTLFQFKQEN